MIVGGNTYMQNIKTLCLFQAKLFWKFSPKKFQLFQRIKHGSENLPMLKKWQLCVVFKWKALLIPCCKGGTLFGLRYFLYRG